MSVHEFTRLEQGIRTGRRIKYRKMNRKETEETLGAMLDLMRLLLPYVNQPEQKEWADMIGQAESIVFATDEEY